MYSDLWPLSICLANSGVDQGTIIIILITSFSHSFTNFLLTLYKLEATEIINLSFSARALLKDELLLKKLKLFY